MSKAAAGEARQQYSSWRERAAWGAAIAAGVTLGGAAAGAGCVDVVDFCAPELWYGPPPDDLCGDPDAGTDAGDGGDASGDASDASADGPPGSACTGKCVPLSPAEWNPLGLVWIGSESQAPPCPEIASQLGYEGHADLHAPSICGECRCDTSKGTCSLPSLLTASAATCAGTTASTSQTPFDPPVGWEGACTVDDAVPAGQLCGGDACVQSVTIAPLGIIEAGCAPKQLPIPTDASATWGTFARMCEWEPHGTCPASGDRCAPLIPPGFRVCIFQQGDAECPSPSFGPYQERHVFYKKFDDARSCSPCTCDPPSGNMCSAVISYSTDDACSAPIDAVTVTSSAPSCHDVPSGSALGSKSASPPTYTPGACEPAGGQPMGSAEPVGPATLCCIPSP